MIWYSKRPVKLFPEKETFLREPMEPMESWLVQTSSLNSLAVSCYFDCSLIIYDCDKRHICDFSRKYVVL